MKRLVALILGVFGAIALFSTTAPAAPPQVGETVTIRFKAVDGAWVNTDTLRGKLVVFDFWATWCGPCMQMVPHMVEMNQKYAAKGLQIVGISLDSDRGEMLKVTKEKGMVWPEYFDGAVWDNKIWKEYGANGIPFTILLSPDGKVLYAGHPAAGLDGAIEKAFKETPPRLVDPKTVADANASLAQIESAIKAGDPKSAIKLMAKVPASARLDGAVAKREDAVQMSLQAAADTMLADVQKQIDAGQYIDSVVRLKELSDALAGLPEAAKAKLMLASLTAKPEVRAAMGKADKELKASEALDVAQKLQAQKKDELAYGRFGDVVKYFPGTEAAGKAQEQVAKYQQDGAFMKRMTEHAAASKATAALHMGDSYKAAGNIDMARKKYQSVIVDFPNTSYAELAQKALADLGSP